MATDRPTPTAPSRPAPAVRFGHRVEDGVAQPYLLIEPPTPARAIASGPYGGGIGPCAWVLNAKVSKHYRRDDPDRHLDELRRMLGLPADGVGLLTAAEIGRAEPVTDSGVHVVATVGLTFPTWAADIGPRGGEPIPSRDDPNDPVAVVAAPTPGTINVVAWVPAPLADAALVNLVATVTEAKVQALGDAGVPGTGTATDAVVVACPTADARPGADVDVEPYGGPRSRWGAPLARATYRAVLDGARSW